MLVHGRVVAGRMPLKILCAGYAKDEKFELERQVRSLFGPLADESWTISLVKLGDQISVSVDGPDERIRGKSFLTGLAGLTESLSDLIRSNGFALPPPAPEPPPAPKVPAPLAAAKPALAAAPSVRPAAPTPPRPAGPQARPHAGPHRTFIPSPATHASGAGPAASRDAALPASRSAPAPKATLGLGRKGPDTRAGSVPPLAARSRPAAPAKDVEPGPAGRSSQQARDTHQCPSCGGGFAVVYEVLPDEPRQFVAVACPHCWKLDRVEVGESAALEHGYHADKLT